MPVAKLQGGKSYSIISDHIGTPLVAIDNEGVKVWERELDIYGKVRKLQGDKWFMPFLYAGQYYDKETDLAYNRFRYYSPDTGAYISQDPIGLAGNNPTLYGYVFDGNTEVDVFGLFTKGDYFQMPSYYKQGYQKHHIIPRTLNHPLLEKLGYDIHQSRNIVYLPMNLEIEPSRTVHNGPHNKAYENLIIKQLDEIDSLKANDYIKKMHIDNLTDNLRDDLLNKRINLNGCT
ncbi:RHS repeat-associated core domain-containing protein [Capnocytophaga canimorsus]|uniref:RHS repeat-associated core domain-containing protein n=1 Tax=Capnocytophaga canimorsus TaxID=28188 RepID=UPI0037D20176